MKHSFLKLGFVLLLVCACKKPKPIIFTGQLLLCRKTPLPIANRLIEMYQGGGNAIIAGSSSSTASALTNANGTFSITFVPGTAYFFAFSGESNSPISLRGREGFPEFSQENFSKSNYDASKPIYVGKTVDMLIVKVKLVSSIVSTDTFGLRGNTTNAAFDKRYTGITADSSTTIVLDTIYNALFTNFDQTGNSFANTIEFGKTKQYYTNYTSLIGSQSLYWDRLSADDEAKREITFFFSK